MRFLELRFLSSLIVLHGSALAPMLALAQVGAPADRTELGCEAFLTTSYVNLIKMAVDRKFLKPAELNSIISSSTPLNPLIGKSLTGEGHIIRDGITKALKGVKTEAQWSEIQREAAALAAQLGQDSGQKETASQQTQKVMQIRLAARFETPSNLMDQSAAWSPVANEQPHLQILRLGKVQKLEKLGPQSQIEASVQIKEPWLGGFDIRKTQWGTLPNGQSVITGATSEADIIYLYNADTGAVERSLNLPEKGRFYIEPHLHNDVNGRPIVVARTQDQFYVADLSKKEGRLLKCDEFKPTTSSVKFINTRSGHTFFVLATASKFISIYEVKEDKVELHANLPAVNAHLAEYDLIEMPDGSLNVAVNGQQEHLIIHEVKMDKTHREIARSTHGSWTERHAEHIAPSHIAMKLDVNGELLVAVSFKSFALEVFSPLKQQKPLQEFMFESGVPLPTWIQLPDGPLVLAASIPRGGLRLLEPREGVVLVSADFSGNSIPSNADPFVNAADHAGLAKPQLMLTADGRVLLAVVMNIGGTRVFELWGTVK